MKPKGLKESYQSAKSACVLVTEGVVSTGPQADFTVAADLEQTKSPARASRARSAEGWGGDTGRFFRSEQDSPHPQS